MSNKLMIRYETDDFAQWSRVSLDKENKPYGDVLTGDLSELVENANGKRLVLVVSGRSLLITSVNLPDGNIRTISSAIPYAMEEQIADDVEHMHFVHGKRQSNETIPVIATSNLFFKNLLLTLADAGLYPTWAVAEPLLLPWKEKELSIFIRGGSAIVRDGEMSGYECLITQLPTLLEYAGSINDDLERIRIWMENDQVEIDNLFDIGDDRLEINEIVTEFDCLTEFGSKQPQANLLLGFEGLDSLQPSSGSWKPAVSLCVLAVLLYLGTSVHQYFSLQQDINAVTQKTEELFRETFPDVKRLVNPLVQAQQKLDQRLASNGQSADALLDILLVLGEAKKKSRAIKINNLEYRLNRMVVHLEGKSVAQIEKFKRQLELGGNTSTNILSTISKEGKVEARMKIVARST